MWLKIYIREDRPSIIRNPIKANQPQPAALRQIRTVRQIKYETVTAVKMLIILIAPNIVQEQLTLRGKLPLKGFKVFLKAQELTVFDQGSFFP